MTKCRKEILDMLAAASEPLSAADLFGRMTGADQVTVYRTLHYLEEHGFAESFVLHCDAHACAAHAAKRYYTASVDSSGGERGHRHWFHCEKCHRFIDLGSCRMDELVREYERENGIVVKTHTLYLTGLCADCR